MLEYETESFGPCAVEILGIVDPDEKIKKTPYKAVKTTFHAFLTPSFSRHKFKCVRWRMPFLQKRILAPKAMYRAPTTAKR